MSALVATRPLTREPHTADPGARARAWLNRLFAGDFPFPIVPLAPLPPGDRTAAEHDAATRAAGCRDFFIVHADPPAGERLIADIARATPDRVLVLSPDPAAADRLTERLFKYGVPVLRALADDENPLRPSPIVSKVTSAALGTARIEQARRETAAAVAAAEQRMAAFAVVAKAVARLTEVNDRIKAIDAEIAEQTARRDRIEADVRAETDTLFADAIAKLKTDHDNAATRLAAELQVLASREAVLAEARQQYAEATRKPGFFGRLFGSKPKPGTPDPAELEKQVHAIEVEAAALASRVAELRAEADAAAGAFATEREKRINEEIATRRAHCESVLAATENERVRAQTEAAALNKVISAAVPGDDHATAERELTSARERAAEVIRTAREATARAVAEARVVVGTPGCLETDPAFAELPDDPPFGLLVLDRAEELPEAEFPRLARCAERWVLVGEALPREPRAPANGAARNGRPVELPFVVRVAKLLSRETWITEGERLVCRLSHLSPDQRREMTREPLADRPEIELRFTAPEGEPIVAEIAFPGATAIAAAKSFLFHELGEVRLRPCGEVVWSDPLTARWPAADTADGTWIDLEPGVREKIVGAGAFAFTAAVSFDPMAGWDAEKATGWLTLHLSPAAGRFAVLPRSTSRS